MQTESEIIQQCRDGNKEAFRWVVQQHQRLVFSLALKMLADEEEAKDVLQETFIRVWRFANDEQQTLENSEWVSIVRMLAEGLSPKQKLAFTLCQLEGLPTAEVELITGLDAKQVKSNLYVARQTIRERLKHLGYE